MESTQQECGKQGCFIFTVNGIKRNLCYTHAKQIDQWKSVPAFKLENKFVGNCQFTDDLLRMASKNTIRVGLSFMQGMACEAQNYRRKYSPWESGIVVEVIVHPRANGNHIVKYKVCLDRKSDHPKYKKLHITVGENDIRHVQP